MSLSKWDALVFMLDNLQQHAESRASLQVLQVKNVNTESTYNKMNIIVRNTPKQRLSDYVMIAQF